MSLGAGLWPAMGPEGVAGADEGSPGFPKK
jgi:hypothetical protein